MAKEKAPNKDLLPEPYRRKLIADILSNADMECEGANYHDLVGLAPSIYEAIYMYIPKHDRVKVARLIAEKVTNAF